MTPREQAVWDAAYGAAFVAEHARQSAMEFASEADPTTVASFKEELVRTSASVSGFVKIANAAVRALRAHRVDRPDDGDEVVGVYDHE